MAPAFALQLLDAAGGPEAKALVEKLGGRIPQHGRMKVVGGSPDEYMRPLDFTPLPGGPVPKLFDPQLIEAELDRLQAEQQHDGGRRVDFASYSPGGRAGVARPDHAEDAGAPEAERPALGRSPSTAKTTDQPLTR